MASFRASDFRTRARVEELNGISLTFLKHFPVKFWWFASKGYIPHTWQILFHGATNSTKLTRFRHLVAGRRGGKTLSAAWEVCFYVTNPEQFHRDAHQIESDRPLWVWCLAKDYKVGRPSLLTFLEVLNQAGFVKDRDFTYNKTERIFEFTNGSLVEFKTADDPQSLRGAGLDILWIDEAAFIPNEDAWQVVYPALTDHGGGTVITTTTPAGKNWFHTEFWSDDAIADEHQFRVEYTSIDNPYLDKEVWEHAKRTYHPIMFKQEFLAAFDAFHGVALHGDWLKYYVVGKNTPLGSPADIALDTKGKLDIFIGVDPILGPLPGHAYGGGDRFAMAAIGIDRSSGQVYLVEMLAVKALPFPDQIMKIAEWHTKYRPQLIGVESNAFQRVFVQQLSRLPGVPNVIPIFAKGKKHERILAMSPLFRTGKIRIHRHHRDFIDEWVSYDPKDANPKDDTLDAMEIALGCAGVLLPQSQSLKMDLTGEKPTADVQELAERERMFIGEKHQIYDPDMGMDY